MNENIKILYIDDELINLWNFEMFFKDDYIIKTVPSAEKALEILKEEKNFVAIFSDQRMPDKTGTQFFYEISSSHPNIYKAIITGYIDNKDVQVALDKGLIQNVFYKPINLDHINEIIQNLIK